MKNGSSTDYKYKKKSLKLDLKTSLQASKVETLRTLSNLLPSNPKNPRETKRQRELRRENEIENK